MTFLQPTTWDEALAARAADPDMLPIAGGTDLMVEFNFDHRPPRPLMDMRGVADIAEWWTTDDQIRIGAAVPYTQIVDELATTVPSLAMAARTIGSPQIRNRGTVGGNLAAASPAGDSAPPLMASDAQVEVRSVRGTRTVPVQEFFTGVKRSVLEPDELIAAIWVTTRSGPQQFSKIGTRNAMVISVASVALTLQPEQSAVGTGMGSVGPTPKRASEAESFLAGELTAGGFWGSRKDLPEALVTEFATRLSAAGNPIDDVRGKAIYRRSALKVMARRTLSWAWADYQKGFATCA